MGIDLLTILTVILFVAVVTLAWLLTTRVRAEKRRNDAIRNLDLGAFCDFLKTNSLEGTIQVVAGKVSDLLQNSFGCDRIIFVRKRRGFFELSYYHNVRHFHRGDFSFRFSRRLADALCADFRPRQVATLTELLPGHLIDHLERHGLDLCFPIFWRENVYGIYFIKSNLQTSEDSFHLLMAALAQSLSAAYHVKWHEQRLDRTRKQLDARPVLTANDEAKRLIRLVRSRNAETVIRGVFEAMTSELELSAAALIYAVRDKDGHTIVLQHGNGEPIVPLDQTDLDRFADQLEEGKTVSVDSILSGNGATGVIAGALSKAGLCMITLFPVAPGRTGILGFTAEQPSDNLIARIDGFRESVATLVQNAESFERARELSYTDGLTGLANQRYFRKRLGEEINRAKRYSRSLAFIIFDMDDLKGINDQYGHQAGDAVIRRMGQILRNSIRAIDIIARYGGDEFCIIMPEADSATCTRFMTRLQTKIAGSRFAIPSSDEEITCTISLGGAIFPDHASDAERLVFAADMALLESKESGRNSARLYQPGVNTENPASSD